MDTTRWDTGQVLANGVLGRKTPEFGRPDDREVWHWDVYDGKERSLRRALEANKLVECPEYYGIPIVWKLSDGTYKGVLLQYRRVTDDRIFESQDEAVDWFTDTARAVAG